MNCSVLCVSARRDQTHTRLLNPSFLFLYPTIPSHTTSVSFLVLPTDAQIILFTLRCLHHLGRRTAAPPTDKCRNYNYTFEKGGYSLPLVQNQTTFSLRSGDMVKNDKDIDNNLDECDFISVKFKD